MKKWMMVCVFLCMMSGVGIAQQNASAQAPMNGQQRDTVPTVIVVEEVQIDSVPLFTGQDMGMLLTDTVPTPEWMTLQMVEVGAVSPEQVTRVNDINTRFVRRVTDLGSKKEVSMSAMKGVASAQDDELKAVLSDEQVQAYQGVKDKIHKRAWHHYCHHCRDMMQWGCE